MKIRYFAWLIPVILLTGAFWGCEKAIDGSDHENNNEPKPKPPSKPVTNGITVEPGSVTLGKGSSQKFVATVTGGSETLIWSVSGSGNGNTQTTEGLIFWLNVDENETAKELIVKAALPDDTKVYGEAVVKILGNEGLAVTNGLAVRPQSIMLGAGDTQPFKAHLLNNDSTIGQEAADVSWSVNSSSGSTIQNGMFTVASGEKAGVLIVTATREGAMSGTAIVAVLGTGSEPVPVSDGVYVSPQVGAVKKGRTMDFKAYRSLNEEIKSGLEWTVFGGQSASTTINGGSLTVAEDESSSHLTVRAKTAEGRYGTAVVAVLDTGGLTSITAIREYLNNTNAGRNVNDPVPLRVNLNLSDTGGNGWGDLLAVIEEAGKFVEMDLSDCVMNDSTFDTSPENDTGKDRIASLILPDAAEKIVSGSSNSATFKHFSILRKVTGRRAKEVGSYSFQECFSLTSVDFPLAVTVYSNAFYKCAALTSVSFPAATSIGSSAFQGCAALTLASLPAVESIDSSAFHDCTALATAGITTVKSIGKSAFQKCSTLRTVSLLAATSIGESAFMDCKGLENVSFPVAAKIDKYAFKNCARLKSVSLPATLTNIGVNPFAACSNLASIAVDPANAKYKAENGMLLTIDGQTLIGYPTVRGNLTLSYIKTVNDSAFYTCNELSTVSLPAATSIRTDAFFGCRKLESASFQAAESVGNYAFYDCPALLTVSLPNAKDIGDNSFYSCDKLSAVSFDKVESVGVRAFYDCVSLLTVSLPSAKHIGNYAFLRCGALTTISLPAATTIGYTVFNGCTKLSSASLPAVKTIGNSAFDGCYNLTSLTLPSAVPTLGQTVFKGTKSSSDVTTKLTIYLPSSGDVSSYTSAWGVSAVTQEGSSFKYGEGHRDIEIIGLENS
ncbi:MAG: leucine-rich repeat protein [Spirochaetaceae bacterium]|nr:leucine-rich repeat protein [Spirochaetaceae bacterium]